MEEQRQEVVPSTKAPRPSGFRGKTLKKILSAAPNTTNSVTWKGVEEQIPRKTNNNLLLPPNTASNASDMDLLLSPDLQRKSSCNNSASSARRTSPRLKTYTANYVITPQEHDVGMALVSMASPQPVKASRGGAQPKHSLSTEDPVLMYSANAANSNSTQRQRKHSLNKFAYQMSFPEIVHDMICNTAKSNPDIMDWRHSGKAFMIDDKHKDLGKIIRKYFRHGKYSSLQRQLNMYGWSKHLTGSYTGCFRNRAFHQESTNEELANIKRQGPPSRSKAVKQRAPRKRTKGGAHRKQTAKRNSDRSDEEEWRPSQHLHVTNKDRTLPLRSTITSYSKLEKQADYKFDKPEALLPLKKRTPTRELTSGTYMKRTPPPTSTPLHASRQVGGGLGAGPIAATPREAHVSLFSLEHGMSPLTWSPFFPGLHRQTTSEVFANGLPDSHSKGGQARSQQARHAGSTVVPGTNETKAYATHSGFQWQPKYPSTPGRADVIPRSNNRVMGVADFMGWAASPMQVRSRSSIQEAPSNMQFEVNEPLASSEDPSPSGPCPFHLHNPSIAPLPILSREPSAALIPVPLVQRVSSSFFLPFFGLAENMRSPMPSIGSPATPGMLGRAS